ncbi:hypothetical protein [uncultured Sunxiuqinia sp.]|uniref:hypothetical protein n=1 Tax=uncultured Sunxiuqinia sp. TaxID=1573825 RepID=UPI00260A5E2D|nr:hypothetical protein [uncultured Sunxiuqinia sp.]
MEQKNTIEVFGTINKRETVFTIDDKVEPGTLVFESLEPFPGYYHETPFDTKPIYMYIALQEHYPLETIIRATQEVEKDFDEKFDAGKGFLTMYDTTYNVLRVRHLNRYDLIGALQKAYAANGIQFLTKNRKNLKEKANIKVVKFFSLEEIDPGIYLDLKEEFHAYIELPAHYTWEEFDALSNRVKYNWSESKFDAAVGAFYHKGRLREFVRIYSNKLSLEYLQQLKKLYLEKVKLPQ